MRYEIVRVGNRYINPEYMVSAETWTGADGADALRVVMERTTAFITLNGDDARAFRAVLDSVSRVARPVSRDDAPGKGQNPKGQKPRRQK